MKFYTSALCLFSIIICHNVIQGSIYKKSHPLEKIIGSHIPEDVGFNEREIFYNKVDKLAKRFEID